MKTRPIVVTLVFSLLVVIRELLTAGDVTVTSLSVYIGIYFGYLSAELGIHFKAVETNLAKIFSYTENPLRGIENVACIDHIDFANFYHRFLNILEFESESNVDITYMDARPPRCLAGSAQEHYYNRFEKIVRGKPNVDFRRLILLTKDNKDWLLEMCSEFESLRNFSLSVLSLPDAPNWKPPLSIQCVDRKYTFIIAIATQNLIPDKRDLVVKDGQLTEKFMWYYDSIFKSATPVIEEGKLNEEGLAKIKGI